MSQTPLSACMVTLGLMCGGCTCYAVPPVDQRLDMVLVQQPAVLVFVESSMPCHLVSVPCGVIAKHFNVVHITPCVWGSHV